MTVDPELVLVQRIIEALSGSSGVFRIAVSDDASRETALWCAHEAARRLRVPIRTRFAPGCPGGPGDTGHELVVVALGPGERTGPAGPASRPVHLRVVR